MILKLLAVQHTQYISLVGVRAACCLRCVALEWLKPGRVFFREFDIDSDKSEQRNATVRLCILGIKAFVICAEKQFMPDK